MRLLLVPIGPVVFSVTRGAGGGDLGRRLLALAADDAAGAGGEGDSPAVAVQSRGRACAVVEDDLARAAGGPGRPRSTRRRWWPAWRW